MKTLKVYTVVVSYNAYKGGFFPRCLDHLAAIQLENDQYHLEHTVFVVDSHSGDQTPALVREAFPNMRVVASDENLGYAGGNNAGISEGLKAGADYIAVVTQDVYVEP